MKCAPFDVRAASVDEQIKTPVGAGGDGKILAGGQKLPTTRQWFGVTEIHGRYSAGWRSTMDRPCRHGSDDHARRPVEVSRSTPPEAIQGDPRPTTVSTSTEPSALAAACLGHWIEPSRRSPVRSAGLTPQASVTRTRSLTPKLRGKSKALASNSTLPRQQSTSPGPGSE